MSFNIDNSNYGYSVATNKTYVVLGNPSIFAYSSSVFQTGSVEVLQYNNISDAYKHKDTIKKIFNPEIYIATETPEILMTDTGSNVVTSSQFLYEYGYLVYTASRFGQSVAVYDTTLAIGDSLFYYKLSNNAVSVLTGSSVDIFSLSGSIAQTASYVTTIQNTFEAVYDNNTSFGESVSLYNDILAVGASSISSSKGVVYLYKNISGTWTHYQTLTGSGTITNSKFGGVVKIDQSGSYNIIVGNKSPLMSNVYVFNYNSSSGYWTQGAILSENRSLSLTQSLQEINNNWPPHITSSNYSSSYGRAVAIYGNSILVGSPTDVYYAQYDGSNTWHSRGAVYFYEDCTDTGVYWRLVDKSYGTADLLKNNYFGFDVEIYGTSSIATSTKTNWPFSQSYIGNTFYKKFDCNPNDHEYNVLGQVVVYQKTTESLWKPITTLTKNKKYGEPYSVYGYDAALYDSSMIIGSPVIEKV
jgi:hypothetical protein